MLFIIFSSGCKFAELGKPAIVKNGRPCADIVISENPPRAVKLAALELQLYIQKMSGAVLPVASSPQTNFAFHIYVGKSAWTDKLNIYSEGLKHGAFRMVSGNGFLILLGEDRDFVQHKPTARGHGDIPRVLEEWDRLTGEKWDYPFFTYRRYSPAVGIWDFDKRGSLYAVYEFLESLGVRWYMPGNIGEVVPDRKTIALAPVDQTIRPDFAYRNLGDYSPHFDGGPRDSVLWRLRMRFDEGADVIGVAGWAHALNHVHSRDEVRKAHPEYFALYGKKRHTEGDYFSPCLSSPGLFDSTVKFARFLFDNYNEPVISVMPNDGYVTHCQCDLCKGKDTPDRGNEGKMSDYVWDFVNRVATELYKTHPDRKVVNVAYGPYRMPPEKITQFSPNVAAGIVQGRVNFNDPKFHAKMLAARDGFLEKVAPGNFCTTDHYLHSRPGSALEGIPVYFPHVIAEDLRSLKGKSFGEYIELSQGPMSAMHAPGINHLNVYVTSRYYWNAGRDINALLDEYYETFYGPAAKEMKAFVEYSETNWPVMRTKIEVIDRTLAMLDSAHKAAGNTVYRKRIDLIAGDLRNLHDLRARLAMDRKDVPKLYTWKVEDTEIKIDGRLDDARWIYGGYGWNTYARGLSEIETGRRAFCGTSFRVLWSERAAYFGIICSERDMTALNITTSNHDDAAILEGDYTGVLIETQGHSFYQIAVNPSGAVYDADLKGGTNAAWASSAEVAVSRDDRSWSVEMRIPYGDAIEGGVDAAKCMQGRLPSELYPWFVNVCRQRARKSEIERSAWSPTGEKSFYVPAKFGEIYVR